MTTEELKEIFVMLAKKGLNPQLCDTPIPLFDSPVRCGDPTMVYDDSKDFFMFPKELWSIYPEFMCRAKGDSMCDAGIEEGDLLVIQLQQEANEGDIVVALDPNGQNTLKRYGGFDEDSGCYLLEYMNEKRYPGKVERVKSFVVQGVARHVIKTLG